MEKETIELSTEIVEKVLNYLANKPWKEVNLIIEKLVIEINAQKK